MPRTRFGLEGYGVRRAGSFSGKATEAPIIASLVCAAVQIYAAVSGAPAISARVAGLPQISAAVNGSVELAPAVAGAPDMRAC